VRARKPFWGRSRWGGGGDDGRFVSGEKFETKASCIWDQAEFAPRDGETVAGWTFTALAVKLPLSAWAGS